MAKLVLSHGDKGGVLKSFNATIYIDKKVFEGEELILVEADRRNPDVMLRCESKTAVKCHRIDLFTHDGWLELVNVMAETPDKDVVVSLPAQIGMAINGEVALLRKSLEKLDRDLVVMWSMSRSADSIMLLRNFRTAFESVPMSLVVIKSGFFGSPDKFYRWDTSQTKETALASGAHEIFIPELHERVLDAIGIKELFSDALAGSTLKFAEKMELENWLEEARAALSVIDAGTADEAA